MPAYTLSQSDFVVNNLTVPGTLVAKNFTSGLLEVQVLNTSVLVADSVIINDSVFVENRELVVITDDFTGTGASDDPLILVPQLTEFLAWNAPNGSAYDGNRYWGSNGNFQAFTEAQRFVLTQRASKLIILTSKYSDSPPIDPESKPGVLSFQATDPDTGVVYPSGSGHPLAGTPVGVDMDGTGPESEAWGILEYVFDTPLPAGTGFTIRFENTNSIMGAGLPWYRTILSGVIV
jgi:hypothetical protein